MNTILRRFTIFLVMMLSVATADCQKRLNSQTPYLKQDFTPGLSNSQIQLINLNYTAMMYWYNTANTLDSLYAYEREKVRVYGKITGIQSASLITLETIYENKKAVEAAIEAERKEKMDAMKKDIRVLKLKNTFLTVGVVGLTLTTIYFAAL